jgi:hypothetical protein
MAIITLNNNSLSGVTALPTHRSRNPSRDHPPRSRL